MSSLKKPTSSLLVEEQPDDRRSVLSGFYTSDGKPISNSNKKKSPYRRSRKMDENWCLYHKHEIGHILWFILGLILLIGMIQLTFAPNYLENIIHDGITDAFIFTEPRNNDENYDKWVTNDQGPLESIPIVVNMQYFNVTNPEEILLGKPPKLKLSPKIVYNEYYIRENISFSKNGEYALSYFKTFFYYDYEKSELAENDNLTIFAPLISGMINFEKNNPNYPDWFYNGMWQTFDSDPGDRLFMTGTAKDLIFKILDFKYPPNNPIIDFEYGLLNNGSGSWYVQHTGFNDESRMGEVLKWGKESQYNATINLDMNDINFQTIDCWTPQILFSPSHFIYQGLYSIKNNPSYLPPFFVSALRRFLYFDYFKSVIYKDIPAEQYNMSLGKQFLNASLYPPNAQYNQFGPSGVFNLTSCFNNLPLFFSMPFFLGAPDYIANNSKLGLRQPNDENDIGFFMVEPYTGAIINANVALQGNVPLYPIPNYDNANNTDNNNTKPSLKNLINNMMIPTYLLTYEAEVPDYTAKQLAKQLNLAQELDKDLYIVGYVSIGLFVFWWALTFYCFGKYGKQAFFPNCCHKNQYRLNY